MQSVPPSTLPRARRPFAAILVVLVSASIPAFAQPVAAASASTLTIPILEYRPPKTLPLLNDVEAVQHLNEQREANGIPGGLTLEPALSEGCLSWATVYRYPAGGILGGNPHEEIPGQPGFTPEGNIASQESDLDGEPGNRFTVGNLWATQFNPWTAAAFHLQALMNPASTEAWYGATGTAACMGTRGTRAFTTSAFYSYPGNGATEVPTRENTGEWPHSPEQDVGLGPEAFVAGAIILWPEDMHASLVSATLQSSRGAVIPTQLETTDGYNGSASFVVPTTKLQPETAYTLTSSWSTNTGPQTQIIHFTSGIGELNEEIAAVEEAGPRRELGRIVVTLNGRRLSITVKSYANEPGLTPKPAGIGGPLTFRLIRCSNGECSRALGVAWKHTVVLRRHLTLTVPHVSKSLEYRLEATIEALKIADTMPVPAGG
jgi:hypothetical protein